MDNRQRDLSEYRLKEAQDSLRVAQHCLDAELYKETLLTALTIQHFMHSKQCLL